MEENDLYFSVTINENELISLTVSDPVLLAIGVILFIPALVLFKAKSIVDFIEKRRKSKVINISNALECKYIDELTEGLTKEHLKNELINEHFYLSTGISVEKELREAILKAYHDAKGKLSFTHYRRALRYLSFLGCEKDGLSLKVKLTSSDKYVNWLATGYGWVLVILGIILLIGTILYAVTIIGNTLVVILSLSMGFFLIIFGLVMISQTLPFSSAMKIKTKLEEQKEKQIEVVEP